MVKIRSDSIVAPILCAHCPWRPQVLRARSQKTERAMTLGTHELIESIRKKTRVGATLARRVFLAGERTASFLLAAWSPLQRYIVHIQLTLCSLHSFLNTFTSTLRIPTLPYLHCPTPYRTPQQWRKTCGPSSLALNKTHTQRNAQTSATSFSPW